MDAREAARLLGCSPRTIYRLADAGHSPWGVKLGYLRRWDILQLEEFIAAGSQSSRTGRR